MRSLSLAFALHVYNIKFNNGLVLLSVGAGGGVAWVSLAVPGAGPLGQGPLHHARTLCPQLIRLKLLSLGVMAARCWQDHTSDCSRLRENKLRFPSSWLLSFLCPTR